MLYIFVDSNNIFIYISCQINCDFFLLLYFATTTTTTNTGKGDLVGCDISMHLLASSNGQGGTVQHGNSGGQDVLVKSSSDVKVNRIT